MSPSLDRTGNQVVNSKKINVVASASPTQCLVRVAAPVKVLRVAQDDAESA